MFFRKEVNSMVRSMTGYGKGEHMANDYRFVVEMKSVNHRYNDISVKLPRFMNELEDAIRKKAMQYIARGKTDIYITFETFSDNDVVVKINEPLAKAYTEKLYELEQKFGVYSKYKLDLVARFADVISVEKAEEQKDVLWEALLPALDEAILKFVEMRQKEGEALVNDILKKRELIQQMTEQIKKRSPIVVKEYKEKLQNRIKELLSGVEADEQRIAMETALFADRSCVDEEITRLESHIIQLKEILQKGGQIGRKLDFLVQEMNREVNTIASKANDIEITGITIEMKSEIEKIREQIQNIE